VALRLTVLLVALLALALVAPGGAAQSTAAPRWQRFDVELTVAPNGDLLVTETQQVSFAQAARKGFRAIPLDRVEEIADVRVGEPGQAYAVGYNRPFTYQVTRRESELWIEWWFPPTTGERTFVLSYRARGAIRIYPDGDQLFWRAVYADRAGPVASSRVTIRFPQEVPADQVRLAGYPAERVSRAALADPQTAVIEAADLPPGVGLEVRAQFPHGLVASGPPSWQAAADFADWWQSTARPVLNFFFLLASLAVLGGGLSLLVLRWYARGKDPAVGALPAEINAPPSDLPPAVVGTLVDERADVQDVVATLVDLANRGVIGLVEERNPELEGSDLDYRVELLHEPVGLRDYERTILGAIFRNEPVVRLSAVKGRFTAAIPLVREQLYREVVRAGLFVAHPEAVRRRYQTLGGALVGVGLVGAFLGLAALQPVAELTFLPFVALAIVGLATLRFAGAMPRRTRLGALEAARWRAFARYLDQLDDRPPTAEARDEFERYLPYAVALGVDRNWVRKFSSVGTPAPAWYRTEPTIFVPGPGPWPRRWGGPGFPGPVPPGPVPLPFPVPWPQPGPRRPGDGGGSQDWSDRAAGGLQRGSDSLVDLLNRASEVLSHGGGSDWSGGGRSGGGGGGGGSGGFE
jgi:uncharacterized membrane protein YgcG